MQDILHLLLGRHREVVQVLTESRHFSCHFCPAFWTYGTTRVRNFELPFRVYTRACGDDSDFCLRRAIIANSCWKSASSVWRCPQRPLLISACSKETVHQALRMDSYSRTCSILSMPTQCPNTASCSMEYDVRWRIIVGWFEVRRSASETEIRLERA